MTLQTKAQHEEDEYIICAKSGVDLISIIDGRREVHRSCGKCCDCMMYFSTDNLHTGDKGPDRWPVVYKGYYCKECYAKPLSE